jgi:two-component system, OmpR family, sensor histidine kinase BaeS
MRNSLIFKLMGAFLLVIAIGSAVIAILTSQATRNAFNLYTTRSGQVWAQRLAPDLANYYSQTNSWNGVDAVLQSDFGSLISPSGMGMGQGRRYGQGLQNSGGMMAGMGQRLILADENGLVVGDTQGELIGKVISASELKNGAAITINNSLVGTLIVTPNDLASSNTPASEFLASVNQAIVSSAVIAGGIALILGTVLFLQIIKPLRLLKDAATAIASGDLDQRVSIRSSDELGDLGSAFNKMAESLASAEIRRRRLVADVAHELRTPLAAIQGTLEGMQDGVLPLDEEQVSALYSETMLLNRLVGDLKLLSLAEAGQLKLEKQETEPSILIHQIVDRAKPQSDLKSVRLETDLPPDLPIMWMDSDRITQVLNNLIGNALRYTPEGGTITVQASHLTATALMEISVRDTGQGINPDDLPYVFDRFYRADKSRTRSSGGSGLGLAIVKQLIEAHGGMVRAESPIYNDLNQRGYGTKISFTIPVQNNRA